MVTLQRTMQGFVFINERGQYAVPSISMDHGPKREVILWVTDINEAHVFPHEEMMKRRFPQLRNCQALKAVTTREVLLKEWKDA